jgi:prephenate dehydrogenase
MENKPIEFAVIGAGRFGIFWGRHLSKYHPVYFYDRDISRKNLIKQFGAWASLEECLCKPFIFLTIPIRRIEGFIKEYAADIRPGSVLIDCASVKMIVIDWFQQHLPEQIYFAASHPLFGPDSARNGLTDHTIALIPGRVPFRHYSVLVDLFAEKMQLRVLNITAEEHDRLMAYNLTLIHHLGRTFHDMQISQLALKMASLSKLNHIARVTMNDSEELFYDFHYFNPFAKEVEEKFICSFNKISEKIQSCFEKPAKQAKIRQIG